MDRLKSEVDRLAATGFDDIESLNSLLHAELGSIQTRDGMNVRSSQQGSLAGTALSNIELRSAQDDPRHATLVLEFNSSGLTIEDSPWPTAVLNPPRPDAPDSSAYWSVRSGDATVILGLASDQVHVNYISISKR